MNTIGLRAIIYSSGMETHSAKMQAFWLAQRKVVQMRARLGRDGHLPGRAHLEEALREEERKLDRMTG
jgi:hypothetical protein